MLCGWIVSMIVLFVPPTNSIYFKISRITFVYNNIIRSIVFEAPEDEKQLFYQITPVLSSYIAAITEFHVLRNHRSVLFWFKSRRDKISDCFFCTFIHLIIKMIKKFPCKASLFSSSPDHQLTKQIYSHTLNKITRIQGV